MNRPRPIRVRAFKRDDKAVLGLVQTGPCFSYALWDRAYLRACRLLTFLVVDRVTITDVRTNLGVTMTRGDV